MNNVVTPLGDSTLARGPVPPRWVLRSAQIGCGLLTLWALPVAVGLVKLVPGSQLPDSDWDLAGASGVRWSDGSLVSDRALLAALVVAVVPLLALYGGSLLVHRWLLPDRSTLAFALVGVCCVGGLTVPWMYGHAAWPGRPVRFLPLAATFAANLATGSFGPLRYGIDAWPSWRAALVAGGAAIATASTAVAIERILRALR